VLLHGRRRQPLAELLDIGRHVHGFEVDELREAVGLTPAYSAEDDRLFRRNVTGDSAESAL
jgi:hypothetical protein